MKVLRSDCCEQPFIVKHSVNPISRALVTKQLVTMWHECIKCQEPCNAIEIEVKDWVNTK